MRIRTILPVIAVFAAACGGGSAEPTTTTISTPTSTITLPSDTQPPTTAPPSTTTTTTTTPAVGPNLVPVYFFDDSGGNDLRPGPFLIPASRNASDLEDTVTQLLLGLTPSEIDLGLSSEIPLDTALNGLDIDGSVATVDLSAAFEAGGGTLSMSGRLAQLVFTVTADPSITGVRLSLDGVPVEVFSGEGLILDDPMTRDSFQDLVPGILIERPFFDSWTDAPMIIEGIAAAFEGVFQLEILDTEGNVVADVPFVQTNNGVGWGEFSVSFEREQLPPMPADLLIRVYELSARDGSVINERIQPISFRSAP